MPILGNDGVNLSTGKLSLPITLGSISGPNGFGDTVTINYSSNGLLEQIKTWNTQSATSILGLGWTLQTSYITRIGNGSWQDSFYLILGGNTYPLLLVSSPTLPWSTSPLTFVTQTSNMLRITYTPASGQNGCNGPTYDTWKVIDSDGVTFWFGYQEESQAVDLSIRWLASATSTQPNNQPIIWSGSSIETDGQDQYATVWRLSSKTAPSGQEVQYIYQPITQNVGPKGQGLTYTMASYLAKISVVGGEYVTFNYGMKNDWEYPAFRFSSDQPSLPLLTNNQATNAYQDRIETQFLGSICFYDVNDVLQSQVSLEYDFLYNHFPQKSFVVDKSKIEVLQDMNKRLLISIQKLTPENMPFEPSQEFDYWGLRDEQLQVQICDSNKDLRTLSTQSLAIRGIKEFKGADKHPSRLYNALFGHLKTIKSPSGALTWYSYSDNSITEKSSWDLSLDKLQDIVPPSQISGKHSISWQTSGQPYWGPDGYVIIRWNGTSGTGTKQKKYIYLTIYEWLGKWVSMHVPDDDMLFRVHSFDDVAVRLSTGVGKFALVRTDIASKDVKGTVSLFHRDAFIPGKWNLTYFTPQTCTKNGSLPSRPNNASSAESYSGNYAFCQLNIGLGDNIVALLDPISGKLHLYNLAVNQWQSYQGNSGVTITDQLEMIFERGAFYFPNVLSTIIIMGNDVFVMKNVTKHGGIFNAVKKCTISYQLFHYDETGSGWKNVIEETTWMNHVLKDMPSESFVNELVGTLAYGYGVVEIVANYNPLKWGQGTLIGRPIVISWDPNYQQVNIQPIYSPNNAGDYAKNKLMYWGNVFTKTPWPWQGDLSGVTNVSNLFNISTATGTPRKYIARYIGGNTISDQGYNFGWSCSGTLSNLPDNSDPWEQMATIDTTVAIEKGLKSGPEDYIYKFYQFNPYAIDHSSKKSPWVLQEGVFMGVNKDWADIERIINETIFFVNLAIMIPVTIASGGALLTEAPLILAADFVLNTAANLTNLATTAIDGISSQILSTCVTNARRGDASLGLDYLLVGTKKTGKPKTYHKKWSTKLKQWVWIPADPNNLLQDIKVYISAEDKNRPAQNMLASDVYRYGSSFIPFSYMGYIDENRMVPLKEWYYRKIYSDQVAFFQNGILSKLVSLPEFVSSNHYHYGDVPSKFSIFQGGNENWTLYAPWGGILAYKPQVYSNYYAGPLGTVWDDVIWEGAKGQYWQENEVQEDEPPTSYLKPPTVKQSLALGLMMARDNAITGPLSDFVVDKVSLDDGYQVYDTHMRYIGYRAIYQKSIGSVMYNQVRVANGATDYITAAKNNGWIEYYYYNGSSEYINSINSTIDYNRLLPFDPSTDTSNPLYDEGKDLTNATSNVNGLVGQCYCQRIMKNNRDKSYEGIEISRQYYYYMGYRQTARNPENLNTVTTFFSYDPGIKSNGNVLQQTNGVVQTFQVTLTASDCTVLECIPDDQQVSYTTTSSNTFYDLSGLQGSNILTGYETGLPLLSQTTSNHMVQGKTNPITQLTVKQNTYAFQNPTYQTSFASANLWNPITQVIVSQTNDASPQELSPVSASATIWTSATVGTSESTYWYPYATYKWIGSPDGSISNGIPWVATSESDLLPSQTDWQLNSFVRKIENGIVQDVVDVQQFIINNDVTLLQGPRQTVLYDVNSIQPIATFTFPNINSAGIGEVTDEMVRFCSFENYEDLSGWGTLNEGAFLPIISLTPYLTTDTCYTGTQSLNLPITPIYWWNIQQEEDNSCSQSQLVLSFFYMVTGSNKNGININIQASTSDLPYITQTFYPSTINQWCYQQVFIDLNNLSPECALLVGFNFENVEGGTAAGFVDAVSLAPLSARGKFTIYDTSIHLIKATIDSNGLTLRNAYNDRQQLIGTAQGQGPSQQVVDIPVQYYSREGNEGVFSPDGSDPNCSTLIQAASGGQYFDFRSQEDLMGWTGSGLIIQDNGLNIPIYTSASQSISDLNWGAGVRVQVLGKDLVGTQIGIGDTKVVFVDTQNKLSFKLILSNQTEISSPIIYNSDQSPTDWLLLITENTIYFYANGRIIFNEAYSTVGQKSFQVMLSPGQKNIIFKDILFIKDPTMTGIFTDGIGKVRQVQSLADLTISTQLNTDQNETSLISGGKDEND